MPLNKIIIALSCSLLLSVPALSQTESKASLNAAPLPKEQTFSQPEQETTAPAIPANRISYAMSAGAMFGSGFGATYLEPTVRYHLNPRLRVFGSMAYMAVHAGQYAAPTAEGGTTLLRTGPSNHYIGHVGADYLVNDRLILSGSVWKDFSNIPAQNSMHQNFMSPGRQGMDFRAMYKITEHVSVTGGLRYTDGASPFYGPFHRSGFGSRGGAFW